ncbi:MAG TPA: calcium/proton exchanger [Candidatus Binatia bacterium]|jgi:Ca2+:H+ antiporter|nr:calcium/proton exchanger [Candidatus Binatia bacterium]
MRIGRTEIDPFTPLLLFVPVSLALKFLHASPVWIFVTSALAIIPLAGLMGEATDQLAERLGAGLGGLLNVSFGNAAELIITIMALRAGLYEVVKASITGSIISNALLVLGMSILVGGLKFTRQTFNRTAAGLGTALLALSAIGLVVPAIFHFITRSDPTVIVRGDPVVSEQGLSLEIAIILFVTYFLSLVFTLRTHSHLYVGDAVATGDKTVGRAEWGTRKSVLVLLVATACVTLMSEFLVSTIEHAAQAFGMTDVFIGVILVAIIGNAAEHSTAVLMAAKNRMDLVLNIAIGSSIQVALFVAPVLVFTSYFCGQPMDLRFTTSEVCAMVLTVGSVGFVVMDGESTWMEGVQLLAVYVILASAFYSLP